MRKNAVRGRGGGRLNWWEGGQRGIKREMGRGIKMEEKRGEKRENKEGEGYDSVRWGTTTWVLPFVPSVPDSKRDFL